MAGHTPGPWKAGSWGGRCRNPKHCKARHHPGPPECVYEPEFSPMEDDGSFAGIATDDPKRDVVWTEYDSLKIRMDDARLITAAPDLLAACKLALEAFESAHAIDWGIIKAAISKAEKSEQDA